MSTNTRQAPALPKAKLTAAFQERLQASELTDQTVAATIGVSLPAFQEVRDGKRGPTVAFMAGAVKAGLAGTFADVAEVAE